MASKKATVRVTGSNLEWVGTNGEAEFAFNVERINPALQQAVLIYGAKQIIADAAAGAKSHGERIALMDKRADALVTGTWGFRDGHGTPRAEADWTIQFAALVNIGALPDTNQARELFKAAKPSERAAIITADPSAQAEYDRLRPKPAADGGSILERMRAALGNSDCPETDADI